MPLPRNIHNFGIAGLGTVVLPGQSAPVKSYGVKPDATGNCPPGYAKKIIGFPVTE